MWYFAITLLYSVSKLKYSIIAVCNFQCIQCLKKIYKTMKAYSHEVLSVQSVYFYVSSKKKFCNVPNIFFLCLWSATTSLLAIVTSVETQLVMVSGRSLLYIHHTKTSLNCYNKAQFCIPPHTRPTFSALADIFNFINLE